MPRLTSQFLYTILLLAIITFHAKAEVFTVTSNADDGVGTLRAAILKAEANGYAEKDLIHFSFVDQTETGRTIILLSQLPNLSSNLEIDGSTQTGDFFGRSTAKVKIVASFTYKDTYYGLTLHDVSDVNIYGLYIQNVSKITYAPDVLLELMHGISLKSAKNIKIGEVGKGNVITGFHRDLASNFRMGNNPDTYVENLSLIANYIGLEADGKTIPPRTHSNQRASAYMQNLYGTVDIGNGTIDGQNVFAKGISIHQMNLGQFTDPLYTTPAFLNFKYNIFGNNLDLDANDGVVATEGIYIGSSSPNTLSTINITDNVVVGGSGIQLNGVRNPVEIKRNYIGVDRNLKKIEGVFRGIWVYYVDNVQIGGNDAADANYIGYCKPIDVWPATSASINKNSFFCATTDEPMILDEYLTRTPPKVQIISSTINQVKGTADPNSQIELFYSDLCGTCSPETYFASTFADANGNWEYNGALTRSVIASATLNGITSEFTRTKIDVSQVIITNTCDNTGSIIGALPLSATYVEWLDRDGNKVGDGKDLLNVPIGTYRLKATNGDCGDVSPWFEIKKALVINSNTVQIKNPTCNTGGSISGLQVFNNSPHNVVYSWKNEIGNEVATTLNLTNAIAGKYTLTISTLAKSCAETYGPIELKSLSGPIISLSALLISPANCGVNSGAIKGIIVQGSGTLSYKWKNSNGVVVATTIDLLNQPSGIYVLEVNDQSSCGAVILAPITISEANSIHINDSKKQVFNPTCVGNNGSVKGLEITGAASYSWKNSSGQVIANEIDLIGVSPGRYQLTASNPYCNQTYDITLTAQANLIAHSGITNTLIDASCGLNNGSITVILQNPVNLPKSYRWVDEASRTLASNTNSIENIDAGTYTVYATDDNGCEIFLATYRINRHAPLTLKHTNYNLKGDFCNQKVGSITGIEVAGGLTPYTYKWFNENGDQIATTLSIRNLSKGKYKLEITDALKCLPIISNFVITNENQKIPSPMANSVQLCAPGEINLSVKGDDRATSYSLYTHKESVVPKAVAKNGIFKVDIQKNVNYFLSQWVGDCESERIEVKVTVGLSGLTVANSFTPNNDGINDIWNLKGIENYPKAVVQVFNRVGNKVFESVGYKSPFNGSHNGYSLPAGVYYYFIKLAADCEIVTGNLTIIR